MSRSHCVGIDYKKYCNACLVRAVGKEMDEINNLTNLMSHMDEGRMTEVEERVLDQVLDDAIWDFCFDVHRSAKLGYLFLEPELAQLDPNWEEKNKQRQEAAAAADEATTGEFLIPCPNCKQMLDGSKVLHFKKCFGGQSRNKKSEAPTARAPRSIRGQNNSWEPSTDAKKAQGKKDSQEPTTSGKKNAKNAHGKKDSQEPTTSAPVKPAKATKEGINFETMTYDEIKAFLDEKCGALTLKKSRCLNSINCKRHTKEKELVRKQYLSRRSDPASEEMDETY